MSHILHCTSRVLVPLHRKWFRRPDLERLSPSSFDRDLGPQRARCGGFRPSSARRVFSKSESVESKSSFIRAVGLQSNVLIPSTAHSARQLPRAPTSADHFISATQTDPRSFSPVPSEVVS